MVAIIQKINDNAYTIELPSEYGYDVVNVSAHSLFNASDDLSKLKSMTKSLL